MTFCLPTRTPTPTPTPTPAAHQGSQLILLQQQKALVAQCTVLLVAVGVFGLYDLLTYYFALLAARHATLQPKAPTPTGWQPPREGRGRGGARLLLTRLILSPRQTGFNHVTNMLLMRYAVFVPVLLLLRAAILRCTPRSKTHVQLALALLIVLPSVVLALMMSFIRPRVERCAG